ncbi:hypothetical protein C0989_010778 [Termitomyces sp. Mn162]|nr:hypothetical protein C0989_010778 [Termitomyces sp. Mn162]
MALKRTFELAIGDGDRAHVDDKYNDGEPPVKCRPPSVPRTPFSKRLPATVQTPFTSTPYPSCPLDSPTNPLGCKRTQNLTHSLPPPTSFSKHLPLRFQFVRSGVSPRMGGIYRVVQVPLSYTFVHLRCLIAFLYGGGLDEEREDRHLFEVKKKMMMYAVTYRPGQIKQGFTAVKLSTARDPCRYKPDDDITFLDDEVIRGEDGIESHGASDSEESGDDGPTWKWELEEEFTLGHVWSRGPELTAGIIYHHNETTAVHITINTTSLPRRQGHSNIPYVFSARGRVRIYPNSFLPLPKPVFSVPVRKLMSLCDSNWSTSSNVGDGETENTDEGVEDDYKAEEGKVGEDEGNLYGDDSDPGPEVGDARSCGFLNDENENNVNEDTGTDDEEEDEDEADNPNVFLGVKKFNAPHAFAAYLRFVHQHGQRRQYPPSDGSDDEDDLLHSRSTPALVHTSSSPMSSSPIRSSSITCFSSPSFVSPKRCKSIPYDPYVASLSALTSLSSATSTPVPAHAAWQLRRIQRVQKRMDKYKKKAWMCFKDEEVEDTVDQLAGDAPGQKPTNTQEANRQIKVNGHDKKSIPPPLLLKKSKLKLDEAFDPFVDEIEV